MFINLLFIAEISWKQHKLFHEVAVEREIQVSSVNQSSF